MNLVGIFGGEFVPADVLVLADDIERIAERIVVHHLEAVGLGADDGRRNGARWVEAAGFVGQVDEEAGCGRG